MHSSFNFASEYPLKRRRCARRLYGLALACAVNVIGLRPSIAGANIQVWTTSATGDIGNPLLYNSGSTVPSSNDSFTADGSFVINYTAADTSLFAALSTIKLNPTTGAGVFNQTAGTLTVDTLDMLTAATSRHPAYNLSGSAVLNASSVLFGNGATTSINVGLGSTVNSSGNLVLGTADAAAASINVAGGTFNMIGGLLTVGSVGTSTGIITVSSGSFNATGTVYVADGKAGAGGFCTTAGNIILSGSGAFKDPDGKVVLGEFSSGASATAYPVGTLSVSGSSTFSAAGILLGGDNTASYVNGNVNLNGGMITAGYVQAGATKLAPNSTSLAFNAAGGAVRALADPGNADFFAGLYLNLTGKGLTFDTNGNAVEITNNINSRGFAGLNKTGAGTLTLTGTNNYAGPTNVNQGTLLLGNPAALGSSTVSLAAGTTLALGLNSNGSAIAVTNTVDCDADATLQMAPTAPFSSGDVGPILIATNSSLRVSIGVTPAIGVNHGILQTTSIGFADSTGSLDVGANDLDITASLPATINGLVRTGYANGSWTAPGICSKTAGNNPLRLTALGTILNSTTGDSSGAAIYGSAPGSLGLFDGTSPASTDVLVKYTYFGDANLDGKVDGSDYSLIDASYTSEKTGSAISGWYHGDFNYDGAVDGSDYTLIDNAFNTQATLPLTVPTVEMATVPVPEPIAAGWICMLAICSLRRRRCQR